MDCRQQVDHVGFRRADVHDALRRDRSPGRSSPPGRRLTNLRIDRYLPRADELFPDLDDFAARFVACRIPKTEWTHLAHLAIGMWHVHTYGADEALTRLRVGIRRLNDNHGTPNSATNGYHETITRAYVQLLDQFLEASPPQIPLKERVAELIAGPLSARDMLLTFYSKDLLTSTTEWVEPDVMALRVASVR